MAALFSRVLEGEEGVKLSESPEGSELVEVVGKISEVAAENVSLTKRLETMERSAAETEIDALVKEGRILPKSRDAMIELSLSNREQFDAILPDKPMVDMTTVGVESVELTGSSSTSSLEEGRAKARAIMEANGLLEKVEA